MKKLSNIKANILYRTENYEGSGVQDVTDVISYEIKELGNIDILDYCMNNYQFPTDLQRKMNDIINALDEDEECDEELIDAVIDNLIREISRQTGRNIRYAIWLADKKTVEKLYGGREEDIKAYRCSDVILSDLGGDGILFGYTDKPEPIK